MSETNKQTGLFSWRAAILTVVIGVISFSSLMVLMAFAPDLEDKDMAGLHAFSKSALGYNFAVEMIESMDSEVEISRNSALLKDAEAYGVLVLTPADDRDTDELEEVDFDRYEPSLIVLPKRWGSADFQNPSHQRHTGGLSMRDVTPLLQPFDDSFGMRRVRNVDEVQTPYGRLPAVMTEYTQIITSGPVDPIISVDEGTVFGRLTDTNVYVLSEPEFFNTHGLKHFENVQVFAEIIDEIRSADFDAPFLFDTTLHGFDRGKNLLRSLLEPPLLGASLFAFAAAILLGWAAFVRFGKTPDPEPPFQTGRNALIASTAGLFAQTEKEPELTGEYGQIAERLALVELGYPDDLTPAQMKTIIEQIETRRLKRGQNYRERPSEDDVKTSGQLVQYASKYHEWKKDMIDGRE